MTLIDVAVILFGLFAGYWVVGKLFFRSPPREAAPDSGAPKEVGTQFWYDVLGVPSAATPEQIRDAYKHLVSKYHPDKVEHLGNELKDLAERKTQQITLAYREGMRARGVDP